MLALLVVIIVGSIFSWPWTGFYPKTFWDWLQLLIVPSDLAILTVWFNAQNSHSSTDPLKKLVELHTKRFVTDEEFAAKKAELLSKL